MIGYDFHPEARTDLDEIWDFIAQESADAADRVISDILAAVRTLPPFPDQGHKRARPDLTPSALLARAGLPHCLRAGRETLVGSCCYSR